MSPAADVLVPPDFLINCASGAFCFLFCYSVACCISDTQSELQGKDVGPFNAFYIVQILSQYVGLALYYLYPAVALWYLWVKKCTF